MGKRREGMPVSFYLPPEDLAKADVAAEILGISRSQLFRLALAHYLTSEGLNDPSTTKKEGAK